MKTRVDQVRIGRVRRYGPNGETSAYRKDAVAHTVQISPLGLDGDEQADPRYHGGPDKALLHYAFDHYAQWRIEQPQLQQHFTAPGAFGENISSTGLTEETVCIGDQYRLGTAIVEVSQGRQPCWKLGHRFDEPQMIREVARTGRCGWYYRVVQTGSVTAGDVIELYQRPHPEWTVADVVAQLIGGKPNRHSLPGLVELEALSANWRERARRLKKNTTE